MRPWNVFGTLLLLVAIPRAQAEDETPEQRTKRVAAAFPAPSAERGFAWDLDVVVGTNVVGTIRAVAEVGDDAEGRVAPHWWTSERGERPGVVTEVQVRSRRDLVARWGTKTVTSSERKRVAVLSRTEKGYNVTRGDDPNAPDVVPVEAADGAWSGFGTLLLLCRLLPAEKAVYAAQLLDPLPESGDETLQEATVTVVGEETWTWGSTSVPAWGVDAQRGRRNLHLAFEPGTRAFLGARFVGTTAVLLPKGVAIPPPPVDFAKPATSAQVAAAKAWLGIMTGDRALVDAAFHWPSAYAASNAGADPLVTETAFREMFLDALKKRTDRAALEPVLVGYLPDTTAEPQEDGTTKVVFPDRDRIPAFTTREIDGVWYVVAMP